MKKIGIGVDNFKDIRENDIYYIDKTKLIEKLLDDGSKVKLLARPRRFGKTLNMSMLKYFFDIEEKEENKKLFKDLYIEQSKYIEKQGSYPVIYLTLKSLKGLNWETSLRQLKEIMKVEYEKHRNVIDSLNEDEIIDYNRVLFNDKEVSLENSLKNLTRFLYKHYKRKVILLIDEYDIPLIEAYYNKYYEEASAFFKIFLGESLKTNEYLEMGVLTGIIRVIKTGIFSDLNNISVHTILDKDYSDCFGFTECEVEKALKDYNKLEEMPSVKEWYDGYRVDNIELYNPWSILNFLKAQEIKAYWVGTSSNGLIKASMQNSSESVREDFEILLNGGTIETDIYGTANLNEILGYKEIWELLLFSGYLTVAKKIDSRTYTLKIPNKEIRELFKDEFMDVNLGSRNLSKLLRNLLKVDMKRFEETLNLSLLEDTSYFDTGSESFYHGLMKGMLYGLEENYRVNSNKESGEGRYDLIIEPFNKSKRAFILEFKISENEIKLEENAINALEQIKKKRYETELRKNGIKDMTLVGVSFYGKKVKVKWE